MQNALFSLKISEEMNDLVLLKPLTYEFVGTVWKLMTFETTFVFDSFSVQKHTRFVVSNAWECSKSSPITFCLAA